MLDNGCSSVWISAVWRSLEAIHEEFCLFPMNPLPDRSQPVLAFGGARAWCIRPRAYMVGSLPRAALILAKALAEALANPGLGSAAPHRGWKALWPWNWCCAIGCISSGWVD